MLIFSGGIRTRSVQGSLLLYVVQINCTNLRDDVDFLTKLKTLEIRFLAIIFFFAILVQDMVVMGKVYPKMYIYIIDNIYICIILHFIIFLLSDPSSSSRKHPHHPFCPSVLLRVNPPRPLRRIAAR